MADFDRRLSPELGSALAALAKAAPNWWSEVLGSDKLLLALRNGYLNVYVNGQSIFKIGVETGTGLNRDLRPIVQTHYKYLLEPDLPKQSPYIALDGGEFQINPAKVIATSYRTDKTLARMVRTATRYAGAEKTGVHRIAKGDRRVIDLEIAFSPAAESDSEDDGAPRMDLAVLVPWPDGTVRLVFCEAKCASNTELWTEEADKTGQRTITVINQIAGYQAFIRANARKLADAYVRTCAILTELHSAAFDPLVHRVGAQELALSVHPDVFLLVYDYDADQRDGAMLQVLTDLKRPDALGHRVIAKGKARSFRLADDILARERTAGRRTAPD